MPGSFRTRADSVGLVKDAQDIIVKVSATALCGSYVCGPCPSLAVHHVPISNNEKIPSIVSSIHTGAINRLLQGLSWAMSSLAQ